MKILRLRLGNLNSLRGEHEIDFTTSPLVDSPLYAIVGPTGAGKTTLLDAITLALYGEVERQKAYGRSAGRDDHDTVMNHGAGDCFAELEYLTSGGRYRSKWSQHRARGKSGGALQGAKMDIGIWDQEKGDYQLLASGKRDTPKKAEEVTGLDYQRFIRAVMLTQGEFARFLKSDAGEKAGILEQITGTEIYGTLSRGAYERTKAARIAYDQLEAAIGMVHQLSAEERAALEKDVTDQRTAATAAREELATVTKALDAHAKHKQLETRVAQTASASEGAAAAWTAAEPARTRLRRHDLLSPLAADLRDEARLREELARNTGQIAVTEKSVTELTTQTQLAEKEVKGANLAVKTFTEKETAAEARFVRGEALEKRRDLLTAEVGRARERAQAHTTRLTQLDGEIGRHGKSIATLEEALSGQSPAAVQQQLQAAETALAAAEGELTELAVRREYARLGEEITREEASLARLRGEDARVKQELAAKEQQLTEATAVLESRLRMQRTLELSATLAEHRTALQPGEPCPLCGAEEHPVLDAAPTTESDLQRARTDARAAENLVLRLTAEARKLGEESSGIEGRGGAVAGAVEKLREQRDQTGRSGPERATLAELDVTITQRRAHRTATEGERQRLRKLTEHLPELSRLRATLAGVEEQRKTLFGEQKTTAAELERTEGELTSTATELKELLGTATVAHLRQERRREEQRLTRTAGGAERRLAELRAQLTTREKELITLRTRNQEQTDQLNTLTTRLTSALSAHDLTIATARPLLLDAPTAERLRTRQADLAKARDEASALHAQTTTELTQAANALTGLPPVATLTDQRTALDTRISATDQRIGHLTRQLEEDDRHRAELVAHRTQLDQLKGELDRRTRLSDLIGSADGKKFRGYAQAITLRRLVDLGNEHLGIINPRYRMEYAAPAAGNDEKLEIIIVDTYMNDNKRAISTLSGGETFLLSLALALGLSDLASGQQLINSLFIDEGFGTLDGTTLDQAMTTLEGLQAQGKTIGLISHVPSIRERVGCKIVLERVGEGVSRLRVEG